MFETKLSGKHLKAFAVEWWTVICPYHFRDPLSGKGTVKVGAFADIDLKISTSGN